MTKTLYEKKVSPKGKVTYVPCAEYMEYDSFPMGHTLVSCFPGAKTRKFNVDPDVVSLYAAAYNAKELIVSKLLEASTARPSKTPITQEQRDAWDAFAATFDDNWRSVQMPSANDIANAVVELLLKEVQETMKSESLKKSYDQFVMLWNLHKQ